MLRLLQTLLSSPPAIAVARGEFKKLNIENATMTNSLIAVFNGTIANQLVQLTNARSLYEFLGSDRQFANWITDRISDYGFVQDEDYIIVTERTNGRPRKEYHITLDMGKELAMVERNEKGRQIRKYFIECERRVNSQNSLQEEDTNCQEAQALLLKLYHFGIIANEFSKKLQRTPWEKQINAELGGHYIYNLHMPLEQALEKTKQYIQASPKRLTFVHSMLSLLY